MNTNLNYTFESHTSFFNMEVKVAIIDIQFVTDEKKNFIKELAIYDYNINKSSVYSFLPPYPKWYLVENSQKQNKYNKFFIHSFDWNNGTTPFNEIDDILIKYKDYKVFVKGIQKKTILKQYGINSVVDIDVDLPSLSKNTSFGSYCSAHRRVPDSKTICALKNVNFIKLNIFNVSLVNYWEIKNIKDE